jgi:hypothetical protein
MADCNSREIIGGYNQVRGNWTTAVYSVSLIISYFRKINYSRVLELFSECEHIHAIIAQPRITSVDHR